MMIRVIIAEVQNGDLKVEMNIIPDTLSCRHFIFSEQTVLMSSFSTGSPTMCECVRFFFFFPHLFIPKSKWDSSSCNY